MSLLRPVAAPIGTPSLPAPATADGLPGFAASLDSLLRPGPAPASTTASSPSGVAFSRHASARLASRGIELHADDLEDLSQAVDQLARKGARESLVLLDDNAFIVGVPDRRVITVMSRGEAVGNIFTNIDSTLVVR